MNLEIKETQKNNPNIASGFSYPLNQLITILFTILFCCNVALLFVDINQQQFNFFGVFKITTFTILIWTVVSFFSAIVSKYSATYLLGFKYHSKFILCCVGFTFSVMLLVASNHVVLLLSAWLLMGVFMAKLIGVDNDWAAAKAAENYAQKYFISSFILLSLGVLLLAYKTNHFKLDAILNALQIVPDIILIIAALAIISAALIQSAIYPFQRWLLSAMTAPTPASALMHAGFVNGSGIILTIFAVLLINTQTLTLLFIIGGITAIVAQFAKLIQTSVKQKLACSTIAQMGFMIMQCGLGFFNAAVAHLILHGFYKAYLFLSSGENIRASAPNQPLDLKIKPLQAVVVLIAGVLGALLFSKLTGKGTAMDSGIFLTLIVAITVGQATYNIVKEQLLNNIQKIILPIILFLLGISCYAILYSGVSYLMKDMVAVEVPLPLNLTQIFFGLVFLIGFFIMKLGIYKNLPWLYVRLLNTTQPYSKTMQS